MPKYNYSVNLMHIFRISFYKNTSGGLPLLFSMLFGQVKVVFDAVTWICEYSYLHKFSCNSAVQSCLHILNLVTISSW